MWSSAGTEQGAESRPKSHERDANRHVFDVDLDQMMVDASIAEVSELIAGSWYGPGEKFRGLRDPRR